MKKVLLVLLITINMFAMGADIVESLTICENKDVKLLVTIIRAEDNHNDRAIFINDWINLRNEEMEYFIPIQNQKSLRSTEQIQKWMTIQFKTFKCSKVSDEVVKQELDRQEKGN